MLSHGCDTIDILCVAGTALMVLDSEYRPSLDVRKNCMSLAPQPVDDIPDETIRVAQAGVPGVIKVMSCWA